MPILQSCYCCCSSAKQLAIAGGIFSLVITSVTLADFLYQKSTESLQSIATNSNSVPDDVKKRVIIEEDATNEYVGSVINPKGFTAKDLWYLNFIKFCCDIMVLSSIPALFIGIYKKRQQHLLPWIVANSVQSTAILIETIYLLRLRTTRFEPVTAFIFTATFFLLFAQVYALLGVISLYQVFAARSQDNLDEMQDIELRPVNDACTKGREEASNGAFDKERIIVPKVTVVNYADDLDLEESVFFDSSSFNGNNQGRRNANNTKLHDGKNRYNKKGKMAKPATPLEAIEEASIELSQSEPSTTQHNRSTNLGEGVSTTPTSGNGDGKSYRGESNYVIEEVSSESAKGFRLMSTEAIASARKLFLLQRRFVEDSPPDSRHKVNVVRN